MLPLPYFTTTLTQFFTTALSYNCVYTIHYQDLTLQLHLNKALQWPYLTTTTLLLHSHNAPDLTSTLYN